MQPGYLSVETHSGHAGLVRLVLDTKLPAAWATPAPEGAGAGRLRYIARFNDSDAALMHAHELLKRRLVDIDARLYRVSPERAIAAVESLDLRHQRVYLDAEFAASAETGSIAAITDALRRRRARRDEVFRTLGYVAIGILLLNLFSWSLA